MINAVGREIPDEILRKMKKPAFTGAYSQKKDVVIRTTANGRCAAIEKGKTAESKLLVSIEDVIEKTGIKDGMTISLILELVQHIAGFIFVVIVLKYGFMQMTIAKLSKSANTGLSMMFPYLVFPVAFALLSYAYFYRALDDIVKLTKKDQTEGGEGQ